MQAELRKLPSVEKLLQIEAVQALIDAHGRNVVLDAIRSELDSARQHILTGQRAGPLTALLESISGRIQADTRPSLQPVINATGVIIHTNLGRALLSRRAQEAMVRAASAYSNLEYSLEAGARGSRYTHAADLLSRLSGAEAAVVVNNNAAAVVVALTALAQGKEVIISRGQLVEIGGGFRVPDIMAQSGSHLVEVGTTNRTYLHDYEQAIDPNRTGLILSVHYSNYQITGFTTQPTLAELAGLAHRHDLPFVEDLGSGTLLDTAPFGLQHEPTIQESIAAGVDLVTASGDKLLGGPQAGLIFGRKYLVEKLKRHPLIRALRVDKTTLAALHATLLAYLENSALQEIPVWQMISAEPDSLARRAEKWCTGLDSTDGVTTQVIDTVSTVGGGSLPGQTLPSKAMALMVNSADALAARLRELDRLSLPPIITRIEDGRLLLDPRTVLPEQDELVMAGLTRALV